MSQASFVPLTCPTCSGDLVGRASDLLAFCNRCGCAWRCDGEALEAIDSRSVVETRQVPVLWLPVWTDGSAAVPAFLCARPLMVARLLSRAVTSWAQKAGLGGSIPLGARLAPESITALCRLASIPQPRGAIRLLAVPARSDGVRVWLLGEELPLYADDVVERTALLAAMELGISR